MVLVAPKRCPRHDIALSPSGDCVLCARPVRARARRRQRRLVGALLALSTLVTLLLLLWDRRRHPPLVARRMLDGGWTAPAAPAPQPRRGPDRRRAVREAFVEPAPPSAETDVEVAVSPAPEVEVHETTVVSRPPPPPRQVVIVVTPPPEPPRRVVRTPVWSAPVAAGGRPVVRRARNPRLSGGTGELWGKRPADTRSASERRPRSPSARGRAVRGLGRARSAVSTPRTGQSLLR